MNQRGEPLTRFGVRYVLRKYAIRSASRQQDRRRCRILTRCITTQKTLCIINSQVVLSRVPEGPIAPYLGRFADSLDATGYSVKWIHRQILLRSNFSRWLGQKSVALQDITSLTFRGLTDAFARNFPRRGDIRVGVVLAGR